MNSPGQRKPKLSLKQFRMALLARDLTISDFARSIQRSRRAVYGAFKDQSQFGPTWRLIEEAFHA